MKFFNDLQYDSQLPINDNLITNGINHSIYISKTFCPGEKRDVYHLKDYALINGEMICLGYIYFYVSFSTKQSKFVGIFVNPEYRNLGLASLLTSSWIKLCLDNGVENLDTIKKQRKPFLVYLLKTYSFEIQKLDLYNTDKKYISIYRNSNNNLKYLLFRDKDFQRKFSESVIMEHDNYDILDEVSDDYTYLDSVLLGRRYDIQDRELAYSKSLRVIERNR